MSVLKLIPACKDYLWGGTRLAEEYGKTMTGACLAESWELSCHPDGPSSIANGPYAGKTLKEYIETEGKEVLGNHCKRFRDFPILVKFIDAKDNLSVQVHPSNRYALKNEGQYGKTEMWYVVDAGENAFLYYGFQKEISNEEFKQRIEENSLLEVLNAVPVHKGDTLFIESGTIHAIGKDILIAEIQQNSNVTYRVYDYGRVGADGKRRDLHIEKALAVTNRVPIVKDHSTYPHIADCDYFTVDKVNLDGSMMKKMEGVVTEDSFLNILVLDGEGTIACGDDILPYKKGESFFLPAGSGAYSITGTCDALLTSVREKASPIRIGMYIGSKTARIGLIDMEQKIIASYEKAVDSTLSAKEILTDIATETANLLAQHNIQMDQCVSLGIGIPGIINQAKNEVIYSNNLGWKHVMVGDLMAEYFPIPIALANDADCAALGESLEGAGRNYRDIVMLTLGRGVGAGVIIDGHIRVSKGISGSELGHMSIMENGELCSCGRRGCLETYVSTRGLKRDVKRVTGYDMHIKEIFEASKSGDVVFQDVIDLYIRRLGSGISNTVNIFRPEIILIGGDLAEYVKDYLPDIQEIVKNSVFGGDLCELPKIELTALGNNASMLGAANLI